MLEKSQAYDDEDGLQTSTSETILRFFFSFSSFAPITRCLIHFFAIFHRSIRLIRDLYPFCFIEASQSSKHTRHDITDFHDSHLFSLHSSGLSCPISSTAQIRDAPDK
jgi:hypothetical protein